MGIKPILGFGEQRERCPTGGWIPSGMSSSACPRREEFWEKLLLRCPVPSADSSGAVGSSDVVVLLHGFPTSSYDWSKVRGLESGSKSQDLQLLGVSRQHSRGSAWGGPCSRGEFPRFFLGIPPCSRISPCSSPSTESKLFSHHPLPQSSSKREENTHSYSLAFLGMALLFSGKF